MAYPKNKHIEDTHTIYGQERKTMMRFGNAWKCKCFAQSDMLKEGVKNYWLCTVGPRSVQFIIPTLTVYTIDELITIEEQCL